MFAKPYEHYRTSCTLSNYVTKFDSNNATGDDALDFAKKNVSASLKFYVHKLYIDELMNVPSSLNS